MQRRKFLAMGIRAAIGLGCVAPLVAASVCTVNRREIVVPGIPQVFDGFTIALLSDLHHSPWVGKQYLTSVARLANSLEPDLIALTGDFIHRGKEWAPGCMEVLSLLKARHGVVAVLGNHDFYDQAAPTVRQGLRMSGITELYNEGIALQRDGQSLWIGGVGDYWRDRQNLPRALSGAKTPLSALLLSHNPDYTEKITDERVGLVLSGHTHGGQCVVPFLGAPFVPSQFGQKYLAGLCRGPHAQVFVTRGVGTGMPPVRAFCPAEVALLTLRKAPITKA